MRYRRAKKRRRSSEKVKLMITRTNGRRTDPSNAEKQDSRPTILCVHQGHELYGSDRSFADAVRLFKKHTDADCEVVLPRAGPIQNLFADFSGSLTFADLFVLRKATIIRSLTTRLPQSIAAVRRAIANMRRADTTYVNTCVIVDYLLAGWITRRNLIVHVREIPTGLAMRIIRFLLLRSSARLIYNSHATKAAFHMPPGVNEAVVWNGIADPGNPAPRDALKGRPLRVLCIGRLNSWKGQDDLIEAVSTLRQEQLSQIEVRIVGGVFNGQNQFYDRLSTLIAKYRLTNVISMHPFLEDPKDMYKWADVVVVPSRLPEPFGRVAIEAMANGCAVIASGHGGLLEIVAHGDTGIHIQPGSVAEITSALIKLMTEPHLVEILGRNGRTRFERLFKDERTSEDLLRTFLAFSQLKTTKGV